MFARHRHFPMAYIKIRIIGSLGLLFTTSSMGPSTAFLAHLSPRLLNGSFQRAKMLEMAKSPDVSLRHDILTGATMKLVQKNGRNARSETVSDEVLARSDSADNKIPDEQNKNFNYIVREAYSSEINQITDVLMKSFHPQSQPMFDSYIRKYKYNHLQMCFDAIPECDRALFVACAIPSDHDIREYLTTKSQTINDESIVGFCCVDGRPPDPSSRLEFLTASTLATTCPRPYLSDLGVLPSHRRKGLGQLLVRACEEWAFSRGYNTMYLKVDEKNKNGMNFYKIMGYKKTVFPGMRGSSSNKWGTDVLLEKMLRGTEEPMRTKTWIKRLWARGIGGSLMAEDGAKLTKTPLP